MIKDLYHEQECLRAIKLNLDNPKIDIVTILCEIELNIQHEKLICIPSKRPTYGTFVDMFEQFPDDYNILVNTDIVLDYMTTHLYKTLQPNSAYALTRYNVENCLLDTKFWKYQMMSYGDYTQDAWAIYKPLQKPKCHEILMGVLGCENRFSYAMYLAGIGLSNPSLTIKVFHCHKTDERAYTDSYQDKGFAGLAISQTHHIKTGFSLIKKQKTIFHMTKGLFSPQNKNFEPWFPIETNIHST